MIPDNIESTRNFKVKSYEAKEIVFLIKSYIGTIDNLNEKFEKEEIENIKMKSQIGAEIAALALVKNGTSKKVKMILF